MGEASAVKVGNGVGLGVSVGGIGVAAVSYTHLRAHETVLDLVCRLLLEKKHTDCNRCVGYSIE